MSIHYKLVAFHSVTNSIQVNFYNDDIPEGVDFSISLPQVNGRYPSGDALDNLIREYVPVSMFERAAMLRAVPLPSEIEAVLQESDRKAASQTTEQAILVSGSKEQGFVPQLLVQLGSLAIPVEVI